VVVRAAAELFLFLLLSLSLARGRPFSLDYAHVTAEERASPLFLKVNRLISAVWAFGFAAMAAMDLLVLLARLPLWPAIAVAVATIAIAITFTLRYPAWAAAHRT
jgi:hypothetical protein